MKRISSWALSLVIAGLALAGCGTDTVNTTPTPPTGTAPAATANAGAPAKVRFALDWTPNTNHTGVYVAQQKGWYKEQGIDLEILPYSDANSPDTLVATGQADVGVSYEEALVTARVSGLPLKSVAAILQTNTSALATLKGSGLDRPAKLEGKRYAGFGATFEEPVIRTMLKQDGAATGAFENITTNLFGYQALVAGQADFLWIYLGWDGVQAELDKIELNTFLLKDYGVPDYYTPVIIANEAFLRDQPDAARRFLAATAQGYEYAAGNAEDAADLLIAGAPPGTFPTPELPRRSAAYLAPFYKGSQPRWGVQTLDYWTNFPRFIAETGLLKTAEGKVVTPTDIDYAALFTNDFLPQP
jgi:ABC-type nitrate/sulfonate/bicarbonate transport system substrate-binding protein